MYHQVSYYSKTALSSDLFGQPLCVVAVSIFICASAVILFLRNIYCLCVPFADEHTWLELHAYKLHCLYILKWVERIASYYRLWIVISAEFKKTELKIIFAMQLSKYVKYKHKITFLVILCLYLNLCMSLAILNPLRQISRLAVSSK
jgi:hypothetical protein